MKNKYLTEIDYLRGIAIIGVIIIHTMGGEYFTGNNFSSTLNINLEQISTFSVPFFIFISGLVWTYNYKNKMDYKIFIKRRLNIIIIPYIFWSILYLIYRIALIHEDIDIFLALKKIIIGSAYFHLYFIILIIQFYFIFPLILKYIVKYKKFHPEILLITLLFNLSIILLYNYNFNYINENIIRKIFVFWIFYFILGSIIGFDLDYYKQKLSKISLFYFGFIYFGGLYYLIFSYYAGNFLTNNSGIFWMRPQVLIYATSSIFIALKFLNELKIDEKTKLLFQFLREIGKNSFGIYLIHILIMNLIIIVFGALNIDKYNNILYNILLFLIVLIMSNWLIIIIKKLPRGYLIVGNN